VKVELPERSSAELRYDDPDYADPAQIERELRRVAEICHQCRRCLPLCPAFPRLFELVDASPEEVAGVAIGDFDSVNELCYHCKLCYNHCPYTPPHPWDVDFPALMRRQQQERVQRQGIPLLRRLTTRTDWIGRAGSWLPGLLNRVNRGRLSRRLMEKTVGIHRDWVQPTYTHQTVQRWARRRRRPQPEEGQERVVLFTTCSVEYSDPKVARAAVRVLERSRIQVEVSYERCCGMPFTDVGDLAGARRHAAANVRQLLPFVEAGARIVVPGPSCSLMLKEEVPRLLESDAARRVADATRDLMEYLYELARAGKLRRDFARRLGRVAYHAPCHLRAQNIGFRSRDLLRLVSEEVVLVDACSGVDGTWGMQARFHSRSLQVADRMLRSIAEAGADRVATDCPLSALRIQEGLGLEAVHPVVLLDEAYGASTG